MYAKYKPISKHTLGLPSNPAFLDISIPPFVSFHEEEFPDSVPYLYLRLIFEVVLQFCNCPIKKADWLLCCVVNYKPLATPYESIANTLF